MKYPVPDWRIRPDSRMFKMPENIAADNLHFELPQKLIAQRPAVPRDHARLLIYERTTKSLTDDYFYNIGHFLEPTTTLVLNNSKVEKARLRVGSTEIFILETINPTTVRAMVYPGKKFKPHQRCAFGPVNVLVTDVDSAGIRTLSLSLPVNDPSLDEFRLTPLPPYINQDENLNAEYQTVYAKPPGSKAAPTAGLHFTAEGLARLREDFPVAELTLHVGLGTFAPLKDSDFLRNKLHSEAYSIDTANARLLQSATHLTAVGTTSARTLESVSRPFSAGSGRTDIFIMPGYEFRNTGSLLTNFHLPGTSLLYLVAGFLGSTDELKQLYSHAIKQQYRFYSFGDAMLIV